jgi:pimeloyl-ACP methyl ester carboxylesterase
MTVMDAAGSRRVLLIGASESGPSCIRFAASRPERLAGLVLFGALAKGSWTPDNPFVLTHDQYDIWLRRLIKDWDGPAESLVL